MSADFGADVSTFPDLDPTFAEISGPRALGGALARRFMTPRGTLDYDPDYGLDLRALLSASVDAARLFSLRAAIEAEAEKDERVLSAIANILVDTDLESVRVALTVVTADGPYLLTLAIEQVSVALLSIDGTFDAGPLGSPYGAGTQ